MKIAALVSILLGHLTLSLALPVGTAQRASDPLGGVKLSDITTEAKITFRQRSGAEKKRYIMEVNSSGVALFDYDSDGWLDIYFVNGSTIEALRGNEKSGARSALYRNNRDGTFIDVTDRAGAANAGAWGMGVAVGDYDNDGDEDLYVTNIGSNVLYRNNGDGTFTDVTRAAGVGLGPMTFSTGCAFGDYDRDGFLDLFVACYTDVDLANLPPPGGVNGECKYRGVPVMCGPRGLKGAPDHLFKNKGNGTFTEVTAAAGVTDPKGYYGFGVGWFDYDDDGWLDLFVANDSVPNLLYHNKGNGSFEEVGYAAGCAVNQDGRAQAGMGIAIGDYDRSGRLSIYVTNFSDDNNTLFHNEDNAFVDVSSRTGQIDSTLPYLGWGVGFVDLDNDADLDIFVCNGHVYPEVDEQSWNTSFAQRKLVFEGDGRGRFREVGAAVAGVIAPRSSRGCAFGDIDNDGDVDVVVNNYDSAPTLVRNEGGNRAGHFVNLRLVGAAASPRDGIGATVFLTAGGVRQRGEVASGRSYCSQSDLRVHFGLGPATKIDSIEVRWPNGRVEKIEPPPVDKFLTIKQGSGRAV
jgi:enediyne biosynthesis protein E4